MPVSRQGTYGVKAMPDGSVVLTIQTTGQAGGRPMKISLHLRGNQIADLAEKLLGGHRIARAMKSKPPRTH